jgi:hypothetical protein
MSSTTIRFYFIATWRTPPWFPQDGDVGSHSKNSSHSDSFVLEAGHSGLYTQRIEGNPMSDREREWIEKYRAALDKNPPRSERRLFRPVLAAIALTALCLGGAIYVFNVHLIR